MVKLLFFFCLLSFTATAQTVKKPTLTMRVTALEKANLKSRSAVTTDRLFAEYKVMQVRFDSVMRELKLVQKRDANNKYQTIYIVADTIINKNK